VDRARRSLQDCRSRRATRGLNQPWREERLGKPWCRSSPPAREHREGEAASEAGARRQSRAIGGGLGGLERASRALGDGRHSEPGKPLALTREWWKRFWFLEEGVGREPGTYVGARQGVSEVSFGGLARGLKHRGGHGGPINGARPAAVLHGDRRLATGRTEVEHAPSSASSSGVGLPQGGLTPVAAEAQVGFGSSCRLVRGDWSARRKPRGSEIRRSVGVLVTRSQLQKSARSIFRAAPRGAERQTKGSRGSKARLLHS